MVVFAICVPYQITFRDTLSKILNNLMLLPVRVSLTLRTRDFFSDRPTQIVGVITYFKKKSEKHVIYLKFVKLCIGMASTFLSSLFYMFYICVDKKKDFT